MSTSDWRDGFLFVGNHLSLDFLNTRPVVDGAPVELLPDPPALLRWLVPAGLIARPRAQKLAATWPAKPDAGLSELLQFREDYRQVILAMEEGAPPSPAFIHRINELLAQHPFVDRLVCPGGSWKRERRHDFTSPAGAFGPILDATADLLASSDRAKIRKCASCVLHFYDTSKKGSRRWCSMAMCGNRSKVAKYTRRKRIASGR